MGAVDFSLLLTGVAFKIYLAGMLPPIGYLTTLDFYIFSCFLFLAFATVSHAMLPLYYCEKTDTSPLTLPALSFSDEQDLIEADLVWFKYYVYAWVGWNVIFVLNFMSGRCRLYTIFLNEARHEVARRKQEAEFMPTRRKRLL